MRLLVISLLLLAGCGGSTRVGFLSNPGSASVDGVVSFVHLTVIDDANGTSVTVTAVTLVSTGIPMNFAFCGDHSGEFPMNATVKTTFNPGATCSTLVSVRS